MKQKHIISNGGGYVSPFLEVINVAIEGSFAKSTTWADNGLLGDDIYDLGEF